VARVQQKIIDPRDPQSHVDQTMGIIHELDGRVSFGDPQDPRDPQSRTIADGSAGFTVGGAAAPELAHNGTIENIRGSWVEVNVTSVNVQVHTVTHNLDVAIIDSTTPNVRWLKFAVMHDGTGGVFGATRLWTDVNWLTQTVTPNAIDLTFAVLVGGVITIDSDHPVVFTLFFTPATRDSATTT
jgi:hypothetical protein